MLEIVKKNVKLLSCNTLIDIILVSDSRPDTGLLMYKKVWAMSQQSNGMAIKSSLMNQYVSVHSSIGNDMYLQRYVVMRKALF